MASHAVPLADRVTIHLRLPRDLCKDIENVARLEYPGMSKNHVIAMLLGRAINTFRATARGAKRRKAKKNGAG